MLRLSTFSKRQAYTTVNASHLQDEQHHQGRWTKRFGPRQQESQAEGPRLRGAPDSNVPACLIRSPSKLASARKLSLNFFHNDTDDL